MGTLKNRLNMTGFLAPRKYALTCGLEINRNFMHKYFADLDL